MLYYNHPKGAANLGPVNRTDSDVNDRDQGIFVSFDRRVPRSDPDVHDRARICRATPSGAFGSAVEAFVCLNPNLMIRL
jgi:hypothetical protein